MSAKKGHVRSDVRRDHIILDELRKGAVVLDRDGHAWQYGGVYWYRAYGDDSMVSSYDLAPRGPFRVLIEETPC